jgi:hypothetical protein
MTTQELLDALDKLKSTMTAVSTGGPRIDEVNAGYSQLFDQVDGELARREIANPLPYRDLWEWYGRWSSDLPTWASRRTFVSELFSPLTKQLKTGRSDAPEPTGWARVDRVVGRAREALASAKGEEDFQTVGLMCREMLISLAQQVYDPDRHPVHDALDVSPTDFKRMIDAYVAVELAGGPYEQVRKHARSALDLALRLQHQRTATFRDAAICLQATTGIVSIFAIIEGRFD